MSERFEDWIGDIEIITCGRGIEVRVGGSDLHDPVGRYGTKPLRELIIGEGFESPEEARNAAIKWLNDQLEKIKRS